MYELVSDVTRTGEWSPICVGCRWDDGGGPHVGARFTGHNRKPDREWSTTSEVVAAEPGRDFLRERYGATGDEETAIRVADARSGIPTTLAAIKRIAESTS